jgi:hypothetical protein
MALIPNLVSRLRAEWSKPLGIHGCLPLGLTVLCLVALRVGPHIHGSAGTDWALQIELSGDMLLAVSFVWSVGAAALDRSKNRLLPMAAACLALLLAPEDLLMGLMFLPDYVIGAVG